MRTKPILGLVAVIAVVGFAASAQAGVSVSFSFGAPVRYAPPVAYCPPPVVYCPPPVVYCPPPVRYYPPPVNYCPPPRYYSAPRYERSHGSRDYRSHDRRGWGGNDRGSSRGYGGHR